MKNRMKTRKNSTFMKELKRSWANRSGATENRRAVRNRNQYPSSTKVGAGDITARRRLPLQICHRRDHRTNEIVQGPIQK